MKKLLLLASLSLSFVLGSCGVNQEVQQKESVEETVSATITLVADEKVISEKIVVVEEGETLQDVMEETFEVVDEEGFITSLEGVEQSEAENKWWTFTVNDEMATVGANEIEIQENDNIEWELTEF